MCLLGGMLPGVEQAASSMAKRARAMEDERMVTINDGVSPA